MTLNHITPGVMWVTPDTRRDEQRIMRMFDRIPNDRHYLFGLKLRDPDIPGATGHITSYSWNRHKARSTFAVSWKPGHINREYGEQAILDRIPDDAA